MRKLTKDEAASLGRRVVAAVAISEPGEYVDCFTLHSDGVVCLPFCRVVSIEDLENVAEYFRVCRSTP